MSDHEEPQTIEGEDNLDDEFDVDSLFDSASPMLDNFPASCHGTRLVPISLDDVPVAQRTAPPIPGLFFEPSILIPSDLALDLTNHARRYFSTGSGSVNQVMLFGRASDKGSGLPPFLEALIPTLSDLLNPHLPAHTHALLFPTSAYPSAPASRQAILNHYTPGEGITPHVDLLTRFADGILGVSLGGGTVMTFRHVSADTRSGEAKREERFDLYLPERSVLVLTGDARYKWSHGIEGRLEDCLEEGEENTWLKREERVSITLRWLLPGADVVGGAA